MDNKEIKQLCDKLVDNYKNPIIHIDTLATKFDTPTGTFEENQQIQHYLDSLNNTLDCVRVNKLNSLVQATWLPDKGVAQVAKVVKNTLRLFGRATKNLHYLYVEEALYLLESNLLELTIDGLPASIQQCYRLLAQNDVSINTYRIYKTLASCSFRVEPNVATRLNFQLPSASKRTKLINDSHFEWKTTVPKAKKKLKKAAKKDEDSVRLFEQLKAVGPKKCTDCVQREFDYKIFMPGQKTASYNLYVDDCSSFPTNLGAIKSEVPTIISFSGCEFSGFFQFGRVNLADW